MKVSELMTSAVITARENTDVADIARLMLTNKVSGIPIVDGRHHLVGIVTEGDLVVQNANVHFPTFLQILDARIYLSSTRHFEEELRRALGTTAADMMTREVLTVRIDDDVSEAATLMADKRVNPVPVLDGERLVGIIS
ncbi:MAG TPA: CBS domain-containing protein, partial [Chloroflexota bacterium]|nr:CBS domain-containing protein [Chloroflexota bacterium]